MSSAPVRWARLDQLHEGQTVTLREQVSVELVEATAKVTRDYNPLHVDPAAARAIGQSRAVAHGVILMGLLSRAIGMDLPGPGSVWFGSKLDFLSPVYPGDEVELTVTVVRVSQATNVVTLNVTARKLPDTPVMRGTAQVRVPSMIAEETAPGGDRDRVAVVTGASRGVGRAIVESLAARGMRVVVNYRSDADAAQATADAAKAAGGTAVTAAADVATPEGARTLFDAAMNAFGRVDIIVQNATPPIVQRDYLETTSDEFRAYFDTYVVGLHELVRLSAAQMRERKFGRIISILSSYTSEVPAKFSAYITGKHALMGLSRALAVELGPWGITVNMVSPTILVGPKTDDIGMAARESISRRTPARRIGHPEDVARVVSFLAGNDAAFISGANLPVTGGILL